MLRRVERRLAPLVQRGISGIVNPAKAKSYGFIKRDDTGGDVFVHSSAIVRVNRYTRVLAEGERVEFDVIQGPKGLEAELVTGKGGRLIRGFCKPDGEFIQVYGIFGRPVRRRFPRVKNRDAPISSKGDVDIEEHKGKRENATSNSGSDDESSYASVDSSEDAENAVKPSNEGDANKKPTAVEGSEDAVKPSNEGDANKKPITVDDKSIKKPAADAKPSVKSNQKADVKPFGLRLLLTGNSGFSTRLYYTDSKNKYLLDDAHESFIKKWLSVITKANEDYVAAKMADAKIFALYGLLIVLIGVTGFGIGLYANLRAESKDDFAQLRAENREHYNYLREEIKNLKPALPENKGGKIFWW